jgi:hypothetical protein
MAFSLSNIRLDGCKLGAPSSKDYRTVFRDRQLPDKVDLRPNCTVVEDQGQLGSCTANASVGALECLYKTRDGRAEDLSRLFVYFNARRMAGRAAQDTGCFIREAMAAILAFGACREATWPYDTQVFAQEPLPQAYAEGRQYGAVEYSRVDGSKGSMSALADGFPVVFGIALPSRCYEEAAQTGIIPRPTEEERRIPQTSGHAMLIVGYDRNDQRFIVRNSWGTAWGRQGYCTIPFDVIDDFCSPGELWIVVKPEQQMNFSVIRPAVATEVQPAGARAEPALSTLASKLREDIRASLSSDVAASSAKIDRILQGANQAPAPADKIQPEFPILFGSEGPLTGDRADDDHPDANNKDFFAGTWRGRFSTKGTPCKAEIVLQPTGDFSSLTESLDGWYAFRSVGRWKLLGKGNIHVKYTDYDPKESIIGRDDEGRWIKRKIHFPGSETIRCRVINKDQLETNLCKWNRVLD